MNYYTTITDSKCIGCRTELKVMNTNSKHFKCPKCDMKYIRKGHLAKDKYQHTPIPGSTQELESLLEIKAEFDDQLF